MKKKGKSVFFIVAILIFGLGYLTFFGLRSTYGDIQKTLIKSAQDIRWGIDIRGGVDVTFSPPAGTDATDEEMAAAASIIKVRLIGQGITDYEVYIDNVRDRIIVRFPWKSGETDFNPEQAIKELGETASLTFREGYETDPQTGLPTGVTANTVILEGRDVISAEARVNTENNQYIVTLSLSPEGTKKFADATGRLVGNVISIWMDDTMISYPKVNSAIPDGNAVIEGNFTLEQAQDLANKINAGALPFKLETSNYNTISPTLGAGARDAMVRAGIIAFMLVSILMLLKYRLPGFVAVIALAGQVIVMIATITGFFAPFPSFTLTLPGIAGIILAIGFGVDANVITAERIKEELRNGKSVESSVASGFKRAFSAILDGNVTVIIVAVVLMAAFGPSDGFFAILLSPVLRWFGQTTAGAIYSFGFTLLVGVLLNLIMGVLASRLMLTSLSKYKGLKKPWLYGGENND